jgi:hypothetical protein
MQRMPLGATVLRGDGLLSWFIFISAFLALYAMIWWQIYKKAGFYPALGLLMLIPGINLIMLMVLAFLDWPIYKKFSRAEEEKLPAKDNLSEKKDEELKLSPEPKIIIDKSLPLKTKKEKAEEEESGLDLPTEKDTEDKRKKEEKEQFLNTQGEMEEPKKSKDQKNEND